MSAVALQNKLVMASLVFKVPHLSWRQNQI